MAYSCRLFLNTGFNSINIPDSPALVNSMSFVDVPALEINQERFLPSVRVRASWNTIKDADYCKVGDFYYTIDSIAMGSGDVAEISLTPDYITSAGGVSSIEILDGLTQRVHVTNDAFGLYGSDDELMAPAYDMDVVSEAKTFNASTQRTFVETTLNLRGLGYQKQNNSTVAKTAKDLSDPDNPFVCTYPVVDSLSELGVDGTAYSCTINTSHALTMTKGQGLFELVQNDTNLVAKGISQARSLGVEEAISGQYSVPSAFISGSANSAGYVATLTGASGEQAMSGVPFVYGSAANNRVWYGSFSPYTIISSVGNSLSANAEEIYGGGSGPVVKWVSDPRRTGKPYFRFKTLNGTNIDSNENDFFRGCVAGAQWNNTPLVLSEKSGSILDFIQYKNSLASNQLGAKQEQIASDFGMVMTTSGIIGGMINGAGSTVMNNASSAAPLSGAAVAGGLATQALSAAQNIGFGLGAANMRNEFNQQRYALDRALESQQFNIQQSVKVPSVMFTVDPQLCSEVLGNGFIVYRVKYKPQDISRIDKILTAFGYKHTKVLEQSDFTNRRNFNYVQGSVSVGNLPRWWANGVSMQLSGGIRIWHVKPNHSYYTNNPVA